MFPELVCPIMIFLVNVVANKTSIDPLLLVAKLKASFGSLTVTTMPESTATEYLREKWHRIFSV